MSSKQTATNNTKEKLSLLTIIFPFSYVAETGRDECAKDDKFWINYETWEKATYGARGPSPSAWAEILNEEE